MLHRLNAELARICNPLFRPHGVDLITSRILSVVLERERVYIGDIVELMALPQSTVSHQIKRLERAELIRRRQDKADNRAFLLELTAKGRRVANRCQAISATLFAELFADMSQPEMDHLVDVLEDLGARLKATSPARVRRTVDTGGAAGEPDAE